MKKGVYRPQTQPPRLLGFGTNLRENSCLGRDYRLLHNHPSGDPSPSTADVDMTRQVVDAARALRIAVHDHLVVGRDGVASLKALGLM